MGFGVWGLGFGVWGLGFSASRFRVLGLDHLEHSPLGASEVGAKGSAVIPGVLV